MKPLLVWYVVVIFVIGVLVMFQGYLSGLGKEMGSFFSVVMVVVGFLLVGFLFWLASKG